MLQSESVGRRLAPTVTVASNLGSAVRVHSEWWLVAGIVVLAAVFRLFRLNAESLWLDEAFSLYVAQQPLDRLLQLIVQHDTHPPLYHTLLHFWLLLGWGEPAYAIRLLSSVLELGSVIGMFLLGRALAGTRVGIISALLLAFSPFHVFYAQEGRMYALLALLCLYSMYFLLRALERPTPGRWIAYIVVSALALYSQVSAAFFLLAEAFAVLAYVALDRRRGAIGIQSVAIYHVSTGKVTGGKRVEHWSTWAFRMLGMWLAAAVAIGILWLPWLPRFLQQSQTYQEFWVHVPSPGSIKALLFDLTSAYLPHWRVPYGQEILLGLTLAIICLAAVRGARPTSAFLLALVVVPVLTMYIVSQSRPIFLPRALIYVAAPYLLLLAIGLGHLQRWRASTALLGLLLLLNLVSLYRIYTVEQKEEWDAAASFVTTHAAPQELVLFIASDAQLAFDQSAAQHAASLEQRGLPVDVFAAGPLEPVMQPADVARIDQLVTGRPSFWLVESHTAAADPHGIARQYAESHYRLVETQKFQGVEVSRYDATQTKGSTAQSADTARLPAGAGDY